ncbi:hypothetical protein ACVU7I_07070 [Patulibacter sp. S7RM1-6]
MSVPRNQPTPPTRVQPQAPAPAPAPASNLDLKTLIISAIASAASAFIFSRVWAPGTLTSAALTPIIVALVREALSKPTEAVSAVLPAPRRVRRARGGADGTPLAPPTPTRAFEQQGHDPYAATRAHDPYADDPYGAPTTTAGGASPVTVYSVRKPLRHRWRIAAITGLLGFVIAAVVITVPELVTGKSITGGGGTTLVPRKSSKDTKAPATTTTEKTTTTTKTVTAPEETVTRTAPQETVPDEDATTTPDETQQRQQTTPTQPQTTQSTPTQPQTTPESGAASGAVTP